MKALMMPSFLSPKFFEFGPGRRKKVEIERCRRPKGE
jgi:hypothetical protein